MDDLQSMPEEKRDLILGIYFLFASNVGCISNWGFYIFSPEFKNEPELKNKIGSIWITSLLDSIEGESRILVNYKREAKEKNLHFLLPVCEQASAFLDTVKEVLAIYTKAEQLFLNDFRDQLVHSWLAKRQAKHLNIKYFDGRKIIKEKITRVEHNSLIRPFYQIGDMDKAIQPLITKFTDRNFRYWQILGDLQQNLPSLRESMIKGQTYYFRSLSSSIESAEVDQKFDDKTEKMPRRLIDLNHKLTDSGYLDHLKKQYHFLLSDIEQYKKGHPDFAIKIAATIRTIFHSSRTSKAVLPHLSQKYGYTIRFRSRPQLSLDDACTLRLGFFFGIRDIPKDYFKDSMFIDSDFETYWNEIVYKEKSTIYTRKQMILFAANKWGGAHVDPEIPPKFLQLIDGSGPKLISEQCGEEMIICRISYETALQTITVLEDLIPILDRKLNS